MIKYLEHLFRNKGFIELTVYTESGAMLSGFYDNPKDLSIAAERYSNNGARAIWTSINPTKQHSATNTLSRAVKGGKLQDSQVSKWNWINMDFDSNTRPKNANASEEEITACLTARDNAIEAMRALGWPQPITAMSGNGAHLMWATSVMNTKTNGQLIKDFYHSFAYVCNTREVKVDLAVSNPGTLWKLYGTMARKGPQKPGRPHRMSTCEIPEYLEVVPKIFIQEFVDDNPVPDNIEESDRRGVYKGKGDITTLDILALFKAHDHYVKPIESNKHAVKCPNCHEHTSDSPTGTVIWESIDNSWPGFHCSHSHCQDLDLLSVLNMFPNTDDFCREKYRPLPPDILPDTLSDSGNAMRMLEFYSDDIRYINKFNQWMVWNKHYWKIDEDGAMLRFARASSKLLLAQAAKLSEKPKKTVLAWVRQSLNAGRLKATVDLAKSSRGITVQPEELDMELMYFAAYNALIDLQTQKRVAGNRNFYITQKSRVIYHPESECPNWDKFVSDIFLGNEDIIKYVQRAVGYSITGNTSEEVMFVLHGSGANGKTTFINAIASVIGDCAMRIQAKSLMHNRFNSGGQASGDIARLYPARFVSSSEGSSGSRFDESLIKDLTGSDRIIARFLYGKEFEFFPKFKLWFATNHKPIIRGTDPAIWRRIHLIPFLFCATGDLKDPHLAEKLERELSGIFNWILEGVRMWLEEGLNAPAEVLSATKKYQADMDIIGQFLSENCDQCEPGRWQKDGEKYEAPALPLFKVYEEWSHDANLRPMSRLGFRESLLDKGIMYERTTGGMVYRGVRYRLGAL